MTTIHRTLILCGALAATAAYGTASASESPSLPVSAAPQAAAHVWLENEPSYFRRGDRLNVRFSVPRDSYVAIVHIDGDGMLDFLYPASPWEDGWVRGGRTHSLPIRSAASTTIRSNRGIGYLYIIASPTPLDFRFFQGRIGTSWDWGYAGRTVRGDPFLAFDQVTRLLLPRWPTAYYLAGYHGYQVGGIHRYPVYACSDRYYDSGWGWYPAYGACNRQDLFLRDHPYYYDTRRYRGDRRVVLRAYDRLDPRHGFKEPPALGRGTTAPAPAGRAPAPAAPANRPQGAVGTGGQTPRRDPAPAATQPRSDPAPAPTPPAQRPPAARDPAAPAATPPAARQPEPQAGRQPEPQSGARARPTPDTGGRVNAADPATPGSTDGAPARGRP